MEDFNKKQNKFNSFEDLGEVKDDLEKKEKGMYDGIPREEWPSVVSYMSRLKVGDKIARIRNFQPDFNWEIKKIENGVLHVEKNGEETTENGNFVFLPGSKGNLYGEPESSYNLENWERENGGPLRPKK
jgi:hypothetical protein